jgi:hypothetical protein
MGTGFSRKTQEERDHYEDRDIGGDSMLRYILKKRDGVVRNGLIWLRLRASEGLL